MPGQGCCRQSDSQVGQHAPGGVTRVEPEPHAIAGQPTLPQAPALAAAPALAGAPALLVPPLPLGAPPVFPPATLMEPPAPLLAAPFPPAPPSSVTERPPHALPSRMLRPSAQTAPVAREVRFFMGDSSLAEHAPVTKALQPSLPSGSPAWGSGSAARSSSALMGARGRAPRPILTTCRSTP
jgi:hypothetical protein